jgi:hypothetical protein
MFLRVQIPAKGAKESDNLSDADVLAQEIIEDLEAALWRVSMLVQRSVCCFVFRFVALAVKFKK